MNRQFKKGDKVWLPATVKSSIRPGYIVHIQGYSVQLFFTPQGLQNANKRNGVNRVCK